jgi:Uma2 family endonuclease
MNTISSPSYTSAIEQLLHSPRLPEAIQQLQDTLETERQKRQHFYDVVTEHQKAEFINGEIIVHSPAKLQHTLARKHLVMLLSAYVQKYQLGLVGDEKMLVSFERNDYEPDICFFGTEKAHTFTPDQMHFPAPDLIVEVLSSSTEAVDRGIKFEDYAAHGVREYWLVDPEDQTVEQYVLPSFDANAYHLLTKLREGSIHSEVVGGFTIPLLAIFDPAENLAILQKLLA